jgi:hypothetical protein
MRKLTPELLDHLPHNDPGAIRSRDDLRRINRFMGNEAWILRNLNPNFTHITEIGAGDGKLLSRIHALHPQAKLTAYDLAPRPDDLPDAIEWIQTDIFENPPNQTHRVLIANLILHHFNDAQLTHLGSWIREFDTIITNEPLRSPIPALLGKLAYPFIHPITRHDMRVSIEAGFVSGELPQLLQLDTNRFEIRETSTWRGAQRMLAFRR